MKYYYSTVSIKTSQFSKSTLLSNVVHTISNIYNDTQWLRYIGLTTKVCTGGMSAAGAVMIFIKRDENCAPCVMQWITEEEGKCVCSVHNDLVLLRCCIIRNYNKIFQYCLPNFCYFSLVWFLNWQNVLLAIIIKRIKLTKCRLQSQLHAKVSLD